MNESYRLGEQSIIAYLQRLANGVSTAELDVAALPTELCAIGEQLQKTFAILQQERELLERGAYIDSLTNRSEEHSPILATVLDSTVMPSCFGTKAPPSPAPISISIALSIATIRLATPRAIATS